MLAVEILHPITDGTEAYEPGPVGKPTIVQNPSARLLELAEPGELHLGKQIARLYDPAVTALELEASEKALTVSIPPLDRVRESAAMHGYELLLIGSEVQFSRLAEDLNLQLCIAQELIAELRLQLEEQAKGVLAPAEPSEVDNAGMLSALSSTDNASQEAPADAPAEGGELAEAAAPLEDSAKPKRGK